MLCIFQFVSYIVYIAVLGSHFVKLKAKLEYKRLSKKFVSSNSNFKITELYIKTVTIQKQ